MTNTIKLVVLGFITWIIYYLFTPTIALDNPSFYIFTLFISVIGVFLSLDYDDLTNISYGFIVTGALSLLILLLGWLLLSTDMFRHSDYQDLIGEIEITDYDENIQPIDPSKIIIIDDQTAKRLGDKRLVNGDNIVGSQVEVGEYHLQKYNDGLYYVAPLLHSGFFKYLDNKDGTDGYIIVNSTNSSDVRYVSNHKIEYQPNAFFGRDLERHLRFNGYMTDFITDYSFEIDDDGLPYWVVTKYNKEVGFAGGDATHTVLVNASTGEITEYEIEDTPLWVDRIQPMDFIHQQLTNWGGLINGWPNLSNEGEMKPTSGTTIVYGNDDKCYYYTGITSVGKDGTILGFILTDTRTKSTKYYRMSGATEEKAMRSAEGAVQEKGYSSSEPRPYNINGELTYVMALKDNEGLIKQVAMVSVSNYEIVSIGNNIKECIRSYKSKLNSFVGNTSVSNDVKYLTHKGVVSRINQDMKNGYYYILIQGENKLVSMTGELSEEIFITQVGDSVIIHSYPSNTSVNDGIDFDNLNIDLVKEVEQIRLDSINQVIIDDRKERIEEIDINLEWGKLSPSEKKELMKK